jgi:regulator of protease activity HflC (stomatin/prohibitin superfamily)
MADASKYEQEKIAQGQQNAMIAINESMAQNEKAAQFLLAKDRIAAFEKLAASDSANKVILPYEVTQMIGSMDIMGDVFFKNSNNGSNNA